MSNMDCNDELRNFCSKHALTLLSESNEIIVVKNSLLSVYFGNDDLHNSIDMDIIDTYNNKYSLTAISLFLKYSKSPLLSDNNSEITNSMHSEKILNDTLSFKCTVIKLLNSIEHKYSFLY